MGEYYRDMRYGVDYENVHYNIKKVNNYWGGVLPMMALEELAVLSVVISHVERGKVPSDDLIEELRDVYISLYALMQRYDIDPEQVEQAMNEKLINKDEEELKKFKEFISFCFLGYPITTGTRAANALRRCGCDRIDILKALVIADEDNWWKDIRGLGKESASVITKEIRKKYSV